MTTNYEQLFGSPEIVAFSQDDCLMFSLGYDCFAKNSRRCPLADYGAGCEEQGVIDWLKKEAD